ncbi:MAG: tryptophan--tRNA ligase [Methermicoccaceae archaeon]
MLDPWGAGSVEDYDKLFDEFGIQPIEPLLSKIPTPHKLMRRRIIFGHRGYEGVLAAMKAGEPFGVMSGFMPSGKAHLGGKMVMDELIWHQQMGAHTYVAIADIEAHVVRGIPWERCRQMGLEEYVLSIIALGLKKGAHIYFQSASANVKDVALELSSKANLSELTAIYGFSGETSLAHMHAPIIQSADILQPQLEEPMPVVVPVGSDQDPHIRLTRDISERMNMLSVFIDPSGSCVKMYLRDAPQEVLDDVRAELSERFNVVSYEGHIEVQKDKVPAEQVLLEAQGVARSVEKRHGGFGFIPPSSTYHRFMEGLMGGKMSSSKPESYIALTESPEEAAKKVMKAKTGGKVSLKEQKETGGVPEECVVYSMLLFHLIEDDEHLEQIYTRCRAGERMCGQCKREAADMMYRFLREHQEKREQARDELDDYCILM